MKKPLIDCIQKTLMTSGLLNPKFHCRVCSIGGLCRMESLQDQRKSFIKGITSEVAKMIAKTSKLPLDEAKKEFKKSRTYNFLAYSNDPFIEEGPEDFFEMFQNERKYGRMVTDIQLYLEKHPELYEKD